MRGGQTPWLKLVFQLSGDLDWGCQQSVSAADSCAAGHSLCSHAAAVDVGTGAVAAPF